MGRGIIAATVLLLAGCALDAVSLDGKRCPCAEGWRCDPTTGRCVVGLPDAGRSDSGSIDAGRLDAGLRDGGGTDAPRPDAGPADGGPPDTGPIDAGDPDLLLWLTMDEAPAAGVVRDSSMYGHDASCTACPTAAAGRIGAALTFDGTAAFLRVPHATTLDAEAYTISAFIRAATVSDTHRGIVTRAHMPATSTPNSVALFHHTNERVFFETFHGSISDTLRSDPGTIPLTEWVHVAAIVDAAGNKRVWVNGAMIATDTMLPLVLDASDVLVGADEDAGAVDGFFAGEIDDVRVYGRVLTDSEIAALAAP